MKYIYILNVQMTGANGGVIHFVDSAFLDVGVATEVQLRMDELYKDDKNYMSYITGPIMLDERKELDLV